MAGFVLIFDSIVRHWAALVIVAIASMTVSARRSAVARHPGKSYSYAQLARLVFTMSALPFAGYEACTLAADLAGNRSGSTRLTEAIPWVSRFAGLDDYAGSAFAVATVAVTVVASGWILRRGGDHALADHPGWLPGVEIGKPPLYRRLAVLALSALPFATLLLWHYGPRWELVTFDHATVRYTSEAASDYVTVFDIREQGWHNWWLAVGVAGLSCIVIGESRAQGMVSVLFSADVRRVGRVVVASTAFVVGFAFIAATLPNYLRLRISAWSNEYSLVEGEVRFFHAQGDPGDNEERWCVDQICVNYGYSSLHNRFSRTAERGGPIREGLRARVQLSGGDIIKLEVVAPEGGIPVGTKKGA